MFGFFRRQSKKKCKNQSTSNKFINEIQCVPVDKYEINFCKVTNQRATKPPATAAAAATKPETLAQNTRPRIMGNTESNATKKADDIVSIVYPKTAQNANFNNNNNNNNNVSETVRKNSQFERCKDVAVQRDVARDAGKRDTTLSSDVCGLETNKVADESKAISNNVEHVTKLDERGHDCVMDGGAANTTKCDDKEKRPLLPAAQSEFASVDRCTDEGDGSQSSKKVNENRTDTITRRWREDISSSSGDGGAMTNDAESPKPRSDASFRDEADAQETFGTAPSSPTNEDTINQATNARNGECQSTIRSDVNVKAARNNFFSSLQHVQKLVEIRNANNDGGDESAAEGSYVRTERVDDFSTSNATRTSTQLDPPSLTDDTSAMSDRASDTIDTSMDEASRSDEDEFEESENKVEVVKTTKKIAVPDSAVGSRNAKSARIRIPDITITESSDSEGENDTDGEYEMEGYGDNCYKRAFPSILYDITEVDEPFSDASDWENQAVINNEKRNIVHQESKFQEQIKMLKCEIENKDMENIQLRGKINDLQRDIMNKTWGMDRLHAELESFQKEAECVRKKLLKVEEDLTKYKTKNTELNEQLIKNLEKENDFKEVTKLQNEIEKLKNKIKESQTELDSVKNEKCDLQTKLQEAESEKNEKIKTIEMGLDEALKQKQKLQAHFEEEYEKLRTVNSDREQQLLNDFEWKLREVELNCKRKLEDKTRSNEEKVKLVKEQLENEITQLKIQLKEVEKIKSYEAEVCQLRGLTQEQERALRIATKVSDQLQSNERCLNDEIEKLRSSLEKERTHLATVQGIHSREIAEKDRKYSFKLEQQKNELNSQWEDKVRRETIRLKLELEKTHKEEKRNLVDEAKARAEKQLQETNEEWEKKLSDGKQQLEQLEEKLAEKEEWYRAELLRLQTNSDRDMLELRRKLDKMDLSYQEQLEKKQEKHEEDIENMRDEYERKIQQNEQNWSQQVSSTRATLELVKEQLQREAETQMEELRKNFSFQLEEQREQLIKEKEQAVQELHEKYNNEMYEFQNRLNEELKLHKNKEIELRKIIDELKDEISERTANESSLQENLEALQNTIPILREKIQNHETLNSEAQIMLQQKERDHAETISRLKQFYENEIKHLQTKISAQKEIACPTVKEKQLETPMKVDESHSSSSSSQSKSSRRKGRGRHKKNNQNPQLTKQFSSSSL